MKIRPSSKAEIGTLVEIWYECSLTAHHFISGAFWQSQWQEMERKYMPMADTYVAVDGNEIAGFVSMVDQHVAALFVDEKHQGKGYGQCLLDFVKKQRTHMQLNVYQKNKRAVAFYVKNDFVITGEGTDEATGEKEDMNNTQLSRQCWTKV